MVFHPNSPGERLQVGVSHSDTVILSVRVGRVVRNCERFQLGKGSGYSEFFFFGGIMRKNWKRKREKWWQSRNKRRGGGEAQGGGWARGRKGARRGRDLCRACPQPSDVAVLITPALIASINNTAL